MKGFENSHIGNIQAGKFFETSVFKGCVGADLDLESMNYRNSLKWVKEHQPEKDFSKPETLDSEQLSQLKSAVSSKVPDVDKVLRFYTAVGSTLDILHGVDGLFELGEYIVTVDLTLNPNKIEGKADVIILADEEEGLNEKAIQIASSEIAEKFKQKIETKKLRA